MISIQPFEPKHVDEVYRLIKYIAATNNNLCVRPKTTLLKAATRPNGGVIALKDHQICGFTALYPTIKDSHIECGSVSVRPDMRNLGIARSLITKAIISYYAYEENKEKFIFADVYETNPHTISLFEELGFTRFDASDWIVQARGLKENSQQSLKKTVCLYINAEVVHNLQENEHEMPIIKVA